MSRILRSGSLKTKSETEENVPPPTAKRRAQTKIEDFEVEEEEEPEEVPARNIEEIRRKNLEDNRAFLEGLLMTKIRDDIKSLTNTLQPSLQPSVKKDTKRRDSKFIRVSENVPVRRSRRLARMDVDGNKISVSDESENEENGAQDTNTTYQRKTYRLVLKLSPEEQAELNQKIQSFFNDSSPCVEAKKTIYPFSRLDISDQNVLKLTPDRLLSMDIHSRSDILAVIGCDRKGTVGLVVKSINDIHGGWSKVNYDFHTEYATCCRFDNSNPNLINSTSYDATFRTCDIAKNELIATFTEPENNGLTAFDYHSSQTCLISEDNGDVILVDIRANPPSIERFDVSKKRIRTLHINPVKSNEFCIAGLDTCVKVWDLRNMSTVKYCLKTDFSCYGAYYNQSGAHIMATTRNDHLISFSCHDMELAENPLEVQPMKRIQHRNYVNRFVTPFTAQPYAIFESYYIIASNKYPRTITIMDENCKTVASLYSENLNSLSTVNISHRTLPVVVGGNSSGRIHVFTGFI